MQPSQYTKNLEETVTGSLGDFETRLAINRKEIRQSQKLRYEVFYREMAAKPKLKSRFLRRDEDQFDRHCDHLLVMNSASNKDNERNIIGSYRLLKQENAKNTGGFYSEKEFKLSELLERHKSKNFLELGRSCVLPQYRNKRTIELLWHGTWSYILKNKIDVLFGCASFPGTSAEDLAEPLSLLHHKFTAKDDWAIEAHDEQKIDMNKIPIDKLNQRSALKKLPPLIKGYLRLGGRIGEGAVIDHQFGTTDVMIILPVDQINPRYVSHYGDKAQRFR